MAQSKPEFSPHLLVYERKFDVALRKSHAINARRRIIDNVPTYDDKMLLHACDAAKFHIDWEHIKINHSLYPELFKTWTISPSLSKKCPWLRKVSHLIFENVGIQLQWNMDQNDPNLSPSCDELKANFESNTYSKPWYRALCSSLTHLDKLVNSLPNSEITKRNNETKEDLEVRRKHSCNMYLQDLGIHVAWSRNSCVIKFQEEYYLFPKSYILMIHNKINDTLSVLTLTAATPSNVYDEPEICDKVYQFLREFAKLSIRYKESFYSIAKVLEARVIAETLLEVEGRRNSDFLQTIITSLDDGINYEYVGSELQSLILSVKTPFRHELGCLSKIMGHPFCDVKQGAADLHQKTTAKSPIVPASVLDSVRYAKENFIRNYILRHGKWPIVEIDKAAGTSLTMAMLKNADPGSKSHAAKYGPVQIEQYDYITLGPLKEFDYIENIIPYIKDRTISLIRSKVFQKYIEREDGFRADWRETRLLLYYLLFPQSKTDHLSYLKKYIEGDWDYLMSYLVLRLVPKEKELKLSARAYGCKTYEDRCRGIVQELNVARFLEEYSDEEAMTPSELQLIKKLLAFRTLEKAYPGYKKIIINVDASSWNNRFRHEAVGPLMSLTLDNLYDTPIFSKTHLAYQNTFLYMPDQDKVYYWDGQDGGIDGLNQYTWVYTYIHQMKVCMKQFPYPYHILCKGDDLRIAVLIPPINLLTKSIDDIRVEVLTSISTIGSHFGHIIKIEDSYASESYFSFSKNAFVNNVEMPQTLRKIQKCYGANNAFMNTTDDYIASSFSNAHSASKTGPSPISSYIVALFWSFHTVCNKSVYTSLSNDQITALLLIPNLLGGFPVIYLHNFFVRAESDLLPPFISLLQFCFKKFPDISDHIVNFTRQKMLAPSENYFAFLIDPYSLPIDKPATSQAYLRSVVSKIIKKKTRNEILKELFEAQDSGYMEQILQAIKTLNVLNGKILSAFYNCTPDGLITEHIRKFESGRSVYDAIVLNSRPRFAKNVLYRAYTQDYKLNMYRIQIMKSKIKDSEELLPANWSSLCPTYVSQVMRDKYWAKRIESVTHPPLQHLLSIGSIRWFGVTDHSAQNHFEHFVDIPSSGDKSSVCFSVGKQIPFIGGSTGTGLSDPEVHLDAKNILSSKVHNLLDLLKWSSMSEDIDNVRVSSNMPQLIIPLIESYTRRPISILAPYAGRKIETRTTQHHVRTGQYKVSIVPNSLMNIYTRFIGNSYSHVFLENAIGHYRVNFLHVYCHSVSIWALKPWTGNNCSTIDRLWTTTTDCSHCMSPITETPMVFKFVPKLSFNLASVTQIGMSSLRAILKQLDEYEAPEYYIPEDPESAISERDAQLGLIQHYLNELWSTKMLLRDRYTGHHLDSVGLRVLRNWGLKTNKSSVSLSDLRQISALSLFEDISLLVFSYIHEMITKIDEQNLIAQLSTIPSEELPWTAFVQELVSVNRFYEMQRKVSEIFPSTNVSVYDNPVSYAPIFGACCYWNCTKTRISTRIAFLSNTNSDVLSSIITRRLEAMRWHFLYKEVIVLLKQSITLISSDFIHDSMIIITIACMISPIEDLVRSIDQDELGRNKYLIVQLFDISDNYREMAEEWLEDDDAPSKYYHHIIQKYSHLPWKQILTEIASDSNAGAKLYEEVTRLFTARVITIFKTDPITCVNKVRSGMVGRPWKRIDYNDTNPHELPVMKVTGTSHMRLELFHTSSTMRPVLDELEVNIPEEWNTTLLNARWRYRPLGLNNISSSRLMYLFTQIGITDLPHAQTYVCLADGYGGYTSVISSLTENSNIIFNTFPNQVGSVPSPNLALRICESKTNVCDSSNIVLGHYDMSLQTSYEYLESNSGNVTIITMDAEVKDTSSITRYNMVHLVSQYYLRNGSPKSLFILKMYVKEKQAIMHVVSLLRPVCLSVYLVKSTASAMDGEIYIVAQKSSDSTHTEYTTFNQQYPPVKIYNKITRYIAYYLTSIENDIGGCRHLKIEQHYSTLIMRCSEFIPIYGWSKFMEIAKTSLPAGLHIRDKKPVKNWLFQIKCRLQENERMLWRELHGTLAGRESTHYNTLAHTYIILWRYLKVSAFLDCIQQIALSRENSDCDSDDSLCSEYEYMNPRMIMTQANLKTTIRM